MGVGGGGVPHLCQTGLSYANRRVVLDMKHTDSDSDNLWVLYLVQPCGLQLHINFVVHHHEPECIHYCIVLLCLKSRSQ